MPRPFHVHAALLALLCAIPGALLGCPAPAGVADNPQTATIETPSLPPLGVYRLTGEADSGEFALTPLARDASALADTFAVDLTTIAGTFFRLAEIRRLTPTRLELTFTFQHPLPIPATRTDLAIFDLRLHVLGSSALPPGPWSGTQGMSAPTGPGGAAEAVVIADLGIANAAEFSSWGDEVVEPALGFLPPTLYPVFNFHTDPGRAPLNPANPVGWNVIPMNSTFYSRTVEFELTPGTTLDLYLALEAAYGASAQGPAITPVGDPGGRQNPRYFNPEFNLKEAYAADVTAQGTPIIGAASTQCDLTLQAWDHQGSLAASGAFDPLTAPTTSLRYASHLAEVRISVPGILPTPLTLAGSLFSGDGTPGNPYTLQTAIAGDQLSGTAGTYLGLVAFRDAMTAVGGAVTPLATTGYSRRSALAPRYDFATYRTFVLTAEVSTNQAPIAEVVAMPLTVPHGSTTELSPGPGTNDPDGVITLYEYDFDYDGSVFTVDASNATGAPVTSPALLGPGFRTMALRVTDDGTPTLRATDTIQITIEPPPNQPPTADLAAFPLTVPHGSTTTLSPGPGTGDPDGSLVLWEYDFDYDGITFTVDASNMTGAGAMSPPLNNPGPGNAQQTMALRVTDNGTPGLTAVDTLDITITPPSTAPTWTQIHNLIANGDPDVPGVTPCIACHIDGPEGLFMTEDKQQTYLNLVNVPSTCGDDYIEPNDHLNSFLYHKISTVIPDCGERMPRFGPYWTPAAIQMVADWINDGAPNN